MYVSNIDAIMVVATPDKNISSLNAFFYFFKLRAVSKL